MASLREQIQTDMIASTKARDQVKTDCLRMAISALKYKEQDKKAANGGKDVPLEDAEVIATVQTLIKQRKDSVEQYEKGGRPELAAKEKTEIAVLEAYLPKQMDDAALDAALAALIKETGATGPKDMGKVMGAAKAKFGASVDGGRLSGKVKEKLAKLA